MPDNKHNRHAEEFLLSIPTALKTQGADPEPQRLRMTSLLTGFTLIELLVVVLIISILAAVALPQYQLAVAKSRLAAVKPLLKAIKNAEENYYLANEVYSSRISQMDIDFPNAPILSNGLIAETVYLNLLGNYESEGAYIVIRICSQGATIADECKEKMDLMYRVWLQHSLYPNKIQYVGHNDLGRKICAAENN